MEGNCKICNPPSAPSKLGRPKKLGKEGRPPLLSVPSVLKYINDIAPKDTNTEKVWKFLRSINLCPLCNQLLNELSCGKYACARCCCNDIKLSNSFTCPCCHEDHLRNYLDNIKAAQNIVMFWLLLETSASIALCAIKMVN